MRKMIAVALILALIPRLVVGDAAVIYDASWSTEANGGTAIGGTKIGLSVNLPAADWIDGGGFDWASPRVARANDAFKDAYNLVQETACIALPLASAGTYAKPAALTITAVFATTQGDVGAGFWKNIPVRSVSGARWSSLTGFYGIVWNGSQLQVCEDGIKTGLPVAAAAGETPWQELKFSVDVETGELVSVYWNGRALAGFESSAFTDSATQYAGAMSGTGGRCFVGSLRVTEKEAEKVEPNQEVSETLVYAVTGGPVTFTAVATNPSTGEALPVTVVSDDASGFTFADGRFNWTAPQTTGDYVFTVSSSIGDETVSDVVTVRVCPPLPEVPKHLSPIFRGSPGEAVQRFGGSLRAEIADGTAAGLSVNMPESLWYWASGFAGWGNPAVTATDYRLPEQTVVVYLPFESTGDFAKPTSLFASATLNFTGVALVGFWSAMPTQNLQPLQNFTGLAFDRSTQSVQAYVSGAAEGMPVPCNFAGAEFGTMGLYDMRFTIDLKKGVLSDIVWNGWTVDLSVSGITEQMTSSFGFGSGFNLSVEDSRVNFRDFQLSGIDSRKGMVILLR